MSTPAYNSSWTAAKADTPSRKPYSDEELQRLRVRYSPSNSNGVDSVHAAAIWTLLDMLEEQRGWRS